jgi:hypothetical protein
MLSMLASLGIGPDAPFSPGSDQTATMEKALALAVPLMRDYFVRSGTCQPF